MCINLSPTRAHWQIRTGLDLFAGLGHSEGSSEPRVHGLRPAVSKAQGPPDHQRNERALRGIQMLRIHFSWWRLHGQADAHLRWVAKIPSAKLGPVCRKLENAFAHRTCLCPNWLSAGNYRPRVARAAQSNFNYVSPLRRCTLVINRHFRNASGKKASSQLKVLCAPGLILGGRFLFLTHPRNYIILLLFHLQTFKCVVRWRIAQKAKCVFFSNRPPPLCAAHVSKGDDLH